MRRSETNDFPTISSQNLLVLSTFLCTNSFVSLVTNSWSRALTLNNAYKKSRGGDCAEIIINSSELYCGILRLIC